MEFISNCTADAVFNAAKALKDGHLVAFPTETVYGLGADATNEKAVSRIYSVKGRPTDHPLIVHISSINKLEDWATDIPDYAIKLAREFWPGPMTLILPRKEIAKDFITGGQNNVGLRVPAQPIALALLKKFEDLSNKTQERIVVKEPVSGTKSLSPVKSTTPTGESMTNLTKPVKNYGIQSKGLKLKNLDENNGGKRHAIVVGINNTSSKNYN